MKRGNSLPHSTSVPLLPARNSNLFLCIPDDVLWIIAGSVESLLTMRSLRLACKHYLLLHNPMYLRARNMYSYHYRSAMASVDPHTPRVYRCMGCNIPLVAARAIDVTVACRFPFCRTVMDIHLPPPIVVPPRRPNQSLFSLEDASLSRERGMRYHIEKQVFDACYNCESEITYTTSACSKLSSPTYVSCSAKNNAEWYKMSVRIRFRLLLACKDPEEHIYVAECQDAGCWFSPFSEYSIPCIPLTESEFNKMSPVTDDA